MINRQPEKFGAGPLHIQHSRHSSANNAAAPLVPTLTSIAVLYCDDRQQLRAFTLEAEALFALSADALGRPLSDLPLATRFPPLVDLVAAVLQTAEPSREVVCCIDGDSWMVHILPYQLARDQPLGATVSFINVTVQKQTEDAVAERARQQEAVADLGLLALKGAGVDDIVERAVRLTSEILDVEFCKVLELLPDEQNLLVKHGTGWEAGIVGQATVPAHDNSQAAFTLRVDTPVFVDDLDSEHRFSGPNLLIEHGVVSGMSVVIAGPQKPFGVLGVHTRSKRHFQQHDGDFLQSIANILGSTIVRQHADDERARLLKAAEKERERLQRVFLQAPMPIAIFQGPNHVYQFVNAMYEEGLEGLDVIGVPIRDLPIAIDDDNIYADLDSVYQTGEPLTAQERWLRWERDDQQFAVCVDYILQPLRTLTGEIEGIIAFSYDVTDRVLAQERVENERQRLLALLEQMPAGVILADAAEDRLILGNQEMERITGRPFVPTTISSEMLDNRVFYLDGSQYPFERWPLTRALHDGETVSGEELVLLRGNGDQRVILANATPVRDRNGTIIAAVSVFADVTDRKAAEQEREKLVSALEQERRRLDELTSSLEQHVQRRTAQVRALASALSRAEQIERERMARVLHDDLQQMLHALQIHLSLLRPSGDRGGQAYDDVDQIVRRAIDVTRHLAMETSPPILRGEGLSHSLHWLCKHMARVYQLHIDLEIDGPIDDAAGELGEFVFQLVRELLFNVVKHAGVNRAALTAAVNDDYLIVHVRDQGVGFDSDEVLTQPNYGSFGIHDIAQRLAMIGAEFAVETAPQQGALVTVKLPLHNGGRLP